MIIFFEDTKSIVNDLSETAKRGRGIIWIKSLKFFFLWGWGGGYEKNKTPKNFLQILNEK